MTDKDLDGFKGTFPGWDDYYKKTEVETMPWYEKNLDHDVENEIKFNNYNTGNFLDLGTGPGTQTIQLSKYDFEVIATDISKSAIKKAKKLSNEINFMVDDILNSKLPDKKFDFILDRGIFHIFDISQRHSYVEQIKRMLNDDGMLFLKCMSMEEKNLADNDMPHKISRQDITDSFGVDFNIEKINDTVFSGNLEMNPKALFAVLKKKS